MKKLFNRAILLEDVLSDFLEVEDILLRLELKNALQPLAAKQMQLHDETLAMLRELIRDLSNDVAQEHRAA
jgi:hypothetical protein